MNRKQLQQIAVLIFLFSAVSNIVFAQSFQWGKRGGSAQSVGNAQLETVDDMDVDVNGNVYVLSRVAQASVNVDGQVKSGNGFRDMALASFKCDGTLRWWRVIGNPFDDYAYNLRVDRTDGVYVAFEPDRSHSANTLKSDNDVLGSGVTYKRMHLVKYDTSGTFKWMRTPQADTVGFGTADNTGTIELCVDSTGNTYWFCQLDPSQYGGVTGLTVPALGNYLLRYDRNGNFLGGTKLPIDNWGASTYITRGSKNGYFYMTGDNNGASIPKIKINGVPINSPKYIAVFDRDGNFLWKKEGITYSNPFYARPVLDKEGSIYLAGRSLPNDTFGTYVSKNKSGSVTQFIIKLDSSGNVLWGMDAEVRSSGGAFGNGLALRNSGEVILEGAFSSLIKWPSYKDSFDLPANTGFRSVITRFNTQTGKVLGMEQIVNAGGDIFGSRVVGDGRNSVFLGGEFSGMVINGNTITKVGGETDFFVVKYGYNSCNCTNIPEPSFNYVRDASNKVTFTYTGTSGITNYKWDFDDGDTASAANPAHTYTKTGMITACVTVRNSCGDNTFCKQFYLFPVGIENTTTTDGINIYPNPAKDRLHIEGIKENTGMQIYDITGRILHTATTTTNKASIDITAMPQGSYMLILTDTNGNRITKKFIKE